MTGRPEWLDRVMESARTGPPPYFEQFRPPTEPVRESAVLMLFGPGEDGRTDVVLTERAQGMRHHPGQVSFPGGGLDPGDSGPADAALREATEEVGLDRSTVEVVGELPSLYMRPSQNAVTPVLAWWREPHPLHVANPREVAADERVPLDDLLDADHRFTSVLAATYSAPAFEASGLYIWGFTAMLLHETFELAGLSLPWDEGVRRPIPRGMRPSMATVVRSRLRRHR